MAIGGGSNLTSSCPTLKLWANNSAVDISLPPRYDDVPRCFEALTRINKKFGLWRRATVYRTFRLTFFFLKEVTRTRLSAVRIRSGCIDVASSVPALKFEGRRGEKYHIISSSRRKPETSWHCTVLAGPTPQNIDMDKGRLTWRVAETQFITMGSRLIDR